MAERGPSVWLAVEAASAFLVLVCLRLKAQDLLAGFTS
jgi:hypothetical protein